MRGGIVGRICFLAFILSVGKAEEVTTPDDLQTVLDETNSLLTSPDDESRSGAFAESSAFSDGGSSKSEAVADSSGGSASALSSTISGHGGSALSRATASGESEAKSSASSLASGTNRGYPYQTGSNSALATAEVSASNGYRPLNTYSPSYPLPISGQHYSLGSGPHPLSLNSGVSSSQAETEAQAVNSNSSPYNVQSPYSLLAPSSYGLNSAQAQAEADAQTLINGPKNLYSQGVTYPYSSYSPVSGPSSAQAEANAQLLGDGNLGMLSLPAGSYGVRPNSAHALADAESQMMYSRLPSSYSPELNVYPTYVPNASQLNNRADISSYKPWSGSPNAYSQAQAQAQSNTPTLSGWENPFRSEFYPPSPHNAGTSSAYAQLSGATNVYNPNNAMSSSQAQAEAMAQSSNLLNSPANPGLNPYSPYATSPYSSALNSATAQAEAQSNVNSKYYSGPRQTLNSMAPQLYPFNSALSSAVATAEAESLSNNGGSSPYFPSVPLSSGNPLSPQVGSSQAFADAKAESTFGSLYGQELAPSDYSNLGLAQAEVEASAQASSNSAAKANANARVIQPHEYIYPYKMNGGEHAVRCTRLHEMWYTWTPSRSCLVCICVMETQGVIHPLCVPCDGCQVNPTPVSFPEWTPPAPISPVPIPDPYPIIISTPVPPPEVPVTCSPLPNGTPFTNPLNPCQLCVCRETVNTLGKPDVQIHCQENPQCILPPDVTSMPPVPDVPKPMPLPMCEKFPSNVLFPHPNDMCKLCKCSVEMSEHGRPEQQITCYPNPECVRPNPTPAPEPFTISPPIPFSPSSEPYPSPQPFPDVITVEPIVPWPPVTTPAPPSPGPLPGPSPHESCRPFPPNQVFQHPWDECQVCMCSEAYSVGMITIEVNCFTKKSCCVETPDTFLPATLPPPTPYTALPGTIILIDRICEFKSFGVEFAHPTEYCQVCTCLLNNGLVTSSCKQSYAPECVSYAGGSSSAEAQASANTYGGLINSGGSSYRPSPFSSYSPASQSQSSAEANALIPSFQGVLNNYGQNQPGQPKVYPRSQAQAQALAQSQGYGQSSASGEAAAGYQQPYLNHQNLGSYSQQYGIPSNLIYGGDILHKGSNAENQAQDLFRYRYPNYRGYDKQLQGLNNIIAGLSNYNQYSQKYTHGVPASMLYPSLYPRPSFEVTPLYQPGQFRDASAQAQAQSSASDLNAQSQSAALAAVEERFDTKSGNPDEAD